MPVRLNALQAAGQYTITAVANGDDGISLKASRFFEVLDDEDFALVCENYQRSSIDVAQANGSSPGLWFTPMQFEYLHKTDNFYYFLWNNQSICFSPRFWFDSPPDSHPSEASTSTDTVVDLLSFLGALISSTQQCVFQKKEGHLK